MEGGIGTEGNDLVERLLIGHFLLVFILRMLNTDAHVQSLYYSSD